MWFHESAKKFGNFCPETDESFFQTIHVFSFTDSWTGWNVFLLVRINLYLTPKWNPQGGKMKYGWLVAMSHVGGSSSNKGQTPVEVLTGVGVQWWKQQMSWDATVQIGGCSPWWRTLTCRVSLVPRRSPCLLCPPSGPERLDRDNMSFSSGVTAPL